MAEGGLQGLCSALGRSGRGAARLAVVGLLLLVTGYGSQPARAASESGCAKAVLEDWKDGHIDHAHPDSCYLNAIRNLPEDLRDYSSAADDISRAWQEHRVAEARQASASSPGTRSLQSEDLAPTAGRAFRRPPAVVLALAGLVVLAGLVFITRFVRRLLR